MNELVQMYLLPGGRMPKRMTKEAIGYDVSLRAIVSPMKVNPRIPTLWKTLFDFKKMPSDPQVGRHVFRKKGKKGKLVYIMDPGETVWVGIGFATEMRFPMFYWITSRGGLATKYGITVMNAPGTIDPDYRGEAAALIHNGNREEFELYQDMRIAQVVFQYALIPEFNLVKRHKDLSMSSRGRLFGSSGI
jgi:dUTP pyrophosphatase